MHWKKSLLGIHKILRLFVNTWTVDEKHYLVSRDNLRETTKIELSQKQKAFCEFFFDFLKSILNIFQEKITLIADVFPDILALKI